ncbi:hypothetical protein [Massilia sp.]|uniref:hypothetical protein n=1 Tax=Massilia sp. TaxID=1882437 RepID=UPI002896F53D|nr:hypothetical protein [Massilia sp.]
MLRKDKISGRGAPSLLTSAQQAEAERNRILSTLEATDGERKRAPKAASGAQAGPAARTPWVWLMFGLVVAAIAGGAGLWYGQRSVAPPPNSAPVLAAATPQPEAAPVPVPAPVPAASAAPAAGDAGAATIQDDGATHANAAAGQSLSEMLETAHAAPATAAVQHDAAPGAGGDVLSQALEAPDGTALAAAAAVPAVVKAAPKSAPKAAPAKPKPVKQVAARKAAPAPQDTDAVLLSALIAHANAAEAAPKKARPSLEQELKACRKQPKADLAACRERACEGRSNVGLCKVQR